jgi:8-oxo-dGTP diphosphatase
MTEEQLIVAAAIVRDGRLLSCRRIAPPALAGRWEFPGGKVEAGESEAAALIRECSEELELEIAPGARLGEDVLIDSVIAAGSRIRIRVYWAVMVNTAEPVLHDHDEVRWLAADELFDVPWIEADLGLVADAQQQLAAAP